jgi:uncharacterized protein YggE
MKTHILLIPAIALMLGACHHDHKNSISRTIEVTGSAEKEVTPDEVYYGVTLTEYMHGKLKVTMPDMEAKLMKKAESIGIKKEDVQVENASMYNYDYYYYDYYYRHKHDNYFATKTFIIKIGKPENIEKLLNDGDSLNVSSAQIQKFDNSNMRQYRDSLKIQALKAAQKKADMLLTSIGEERGQAISITEIEPVEYNYPSYYGYYGGGFGNLSNAVSTDESANRSTVNTAAFKDMKLRYEMKVVYSIK